MAAPVLSLALHDSGHQTAVLFTPCIETSTGHCEGPRPPMDVLEKTKNFAPE